MSFEPVNVVDLEEGEMSMILLGPRGDYWGQSMNAPRVDITGHSHRSNFQSCRYMMCRVITRPEQKTISYSLVCELIVPREGPSGWDGHRPSNFVPFPKSGEPFARPSPISRAHSPPPPAPADGQGLGSGPRRRNNSVLSRVGNSTICYNEAYPFDI